MRQIFELKPQNGQKSFSGKAQVVIEDDGTETLYSYGTPIIRRTQDGEIVKLWHEWSATTGKHIKVFCNLDKAGFLALP